MHPVGIAFASLVGLALALRLWLAHRQVRHVRAHRNTVPSVFADAADPTTQRRAADYTVARTRVTAVDHIVEAAVLLAWTLGGGLALADRAWASLGLGPVTTGVGLLVSVALATALVDLPLRVWCTFGVERAFGFNRTTPGLFALDQLKSVALLVALGAPWGAAVLALMHHAGPVWWLYAWGVWLGFNLLVILAWPALIAPLFNRFTPLRDSALRTELAPLLAANGFDGSAVYVADGSRRSSHSNAYFSGFGRGQRIVLFDTLLEQLRPAEIKAVLAHELGHFHGRHVFKRLMLSAAASLAALAALAGLLEQPGFYAGLGIPQESRPCALAVFALALPMITLGIQPLLARLSRRHEYQADGFAVAQGLAPELARALVKLYRGNAATLATDPLWSRFYDGHPPPSERVRHLLGAAGRVTI